MIDDPMKIVRVVYSGFLVKFVIKDSQSLGMSMGEKPLAKQSPLAGSMLVGDVRSVVL